MLPGSPDPTARPLVFAHRGSSAVLPEHTLDAYRQAIAEGADGLECDVRLTRDGHLVCIHDRRLERTSNGRGVVSASTLAQVLDLDFGSWHPGSVEQPREPAPARVLTMAQLLDAAMAAGRQLRLLIETKHPTRHGASVERELVALLARYGLHRDDPGAPVRVTVMSFSALAMRRVRALAPQLATAFLFELAPFAVSAVRPPFGARVLGPGVRVLRSRPDLVDQAHARGHQVYVWTVNSPEDVDLALNLGVDGIISDRPGYVLSRLPA